MSVVKFVGDLFLSLSGMFITLFDSGLWVGIR